jgi:gas vesicle protein GvpL/GvpF
MARTTKRRSEPTKRRSAPTMGWYVYGIVEPDVVVLPDTRGIGDPPAAVEVVSSGAVGALVSEIKLDRPIGTSDDLLAHENLLDATVADAPVLPMRFGAVVASRDAVVDELLAPHEDEFADALRELSGEVQYVLRVRYDEGALMREILGEDRTAASLRERLAGRPPESTQDIRLELGERVNAAVEAKRNADTDALVRTLEPVSRSVSVRPPTHDLDAAHLAMLVVTDQEDPFLRTVRRIAQDGKGRVTARLLGPMAPYDFVVTTRPAEMG